MEVRIIDDTQDVSVELLGAGHYRVWVDAFHDEPPYHRANYWADVDKTGLLDLLESFLDLPDYQDLLELIDVEANTTAGT